MQSYSEILGFGLEPMNLGEVANPVEPVTHDQFSRGPGEFILLFSMYGSLSSRSVSVY